MNKIRQLFTGMGVFLVDLLKLDQPGRGKLELQQELLALSAGSKGALRDYYVRKISVFLGVLTAGTLLSLLGLLVFMGSGQDIVMQKLERPGYGEGDRKEALTVEIEGEQEAQQVEVTVQERKYTDQEKQELLDTALEQLPQTILGENKSLDMVRSDLYFPQSMEDGAVKLSWLTVPYGVLDEGGSIKSAEDENGTLVEIQGTLICGGREAAYTVFARVFPPELTREERLRQSIGEEVALADDNGSHDELLELPGSVDGKTLTWKKRSDNPALALLALTLVTALCIYLEMDSQVHKRAEERKRQLLLDYPDLMWKMTMLLGAGLSIKGTFLRISEEYLRQKAGASKGGRKEKHKVRFVYEEVTYACREMNSGISEAQAYERFGKRCQLPEYIRIGSVLSQNLKKGSRGLTALLETEAEASLNDRKNHARKIGEQAGTKLLLPMILMLGIVLVILMVPAFLSF